MTDDKNGYNIWLKNQGAAKFVEAGLQNGDRDPSLWPK